MAIITNIRHTPSGIYSTIIRGGDKFEAILNDKLARFDALNSGTYVEITSRDLALLHNGQNPFETETAARLKSNN